MADAKTVKAVVNIDVYRWHPSGEVGSQIEEAYRGDTVEVPAKEFERAQTMTPAGLVKAGSDRAKAAAAPPPATPAPGPSPALPDDLAELSDKDLASLAEQRGLYVGENVTRDELLASLAAAPSSPPTTPNA